MTSETLKEKAEHEFNSCIVLKLLLFCYNSCTVLLNMKYPQTNWMGAISDLMLVDCHGTVLLYVDESHKEMKK